jgi:hypothetical protein
MNSKAPAPKSGGFLLTGFGAASVGASLLAKKPRALRGIWFYALSFTTFASRLAPTVELGKPASRHRCDAAPRQASSHRYALPAGDGVHPPSRSSVSSPRLLLICPPLGRLSGGVHPGMGAQRRSTQSNPLHVGAAKPTGGRCPRMNAGAKERRASARGRTLRASLFCLLFLAFEKK